MSIPATISNVLRHKPIAFSKTRRHTLPVISAIENLSLSSEGLFQSIWEKALDGMRITDEHGVIVAVNPAYCKLVGMQAHELIGRPFFEAYEPTNDSSDVIEKYKKRFQERSAEGLFSRHVVLRNGKHVHIESANAFITSVDGATLLLGIFRDVTGRKAAEQAVIESEKKYHELFDNAIQGVFQSSPDGKLIAANPALVKMLGYTSIGELQGIDLATVYVNQEDRRQLMQTLNEQKDKLFSVLSHDLRSPFSSILGFCDILLQEGEQPSVQKRKEFLMYIRESAEQQLGLVNKLLEWSRLETGRIKLEIKELDLRTVVRNSITSLLGIAKQKDILLYSNLGPGMTIRGDEDLLGQVFTNLIGNALKFTPEKGVIAVEFVQDTGDAWMIALRDSGAGIPQEDLNKLFKVGEQYTRKGLEGEKGTGLGLPLVYEIVQKHHGTISVESEVGKGTIFTLKFPKFSSKEEHNVVIVDDEQGMRTLHARYLRKAFPKANVILASNGNEALQCAKKYSPKLIISDYAMPEMDGIQLLKSLKQDSSTKDIPVLMITGEDSDASKESLLLNGAYGVLVKPISVEAMEHVVNSLGMGRP